MVCLFLPKPHPVNLIYYHYNWDYAEKKFMNQFQTDNPVQRATVYIIRFRLNSSLLKWRHYAANAHQLCVLIPVSLITLLCPCISGATATASVHGPTRTKGTHTRWQGRRGNFGHTNSLDECMLPGYTWLIARPWNRRQHGPKETGGSGYVLTATSIGKRVRIY